MHGNRTNKRYSSIHRQVVTAKMHVVIFALISFHIHKGVLLTPSYKAMNLYGSEYWTYFLPRRVGHEKAQQLVRETTPISVHEAESIGFLDKVFPMNKENMLEELPEYLQELQSDGKIKDVIRKKNSQRDSSWRWLIDQHRAFELSQMRRNFRSTDFLAAMHNFVYHKTG